MRNIIINEEQEKLFGEAIQQQHVLEHLSDKIKHDIETDNTPISNLPVPHAVNKKLINKLVSDGYFSAKNNFTDDIEAVSIEKIINKLDKLTVICQKKEEKIHNELEKLCVDIAVSYFNEEMFEDITLECRLVTDLSQDDFHIEPSNPVDFNNYEKTELAVNNRKISNTLVMGGAMSLYDKLQETFIPELFKLDEDLPHLYSKILKINEYLAFVSNVTPADGDNRQSGCVKITIGDEESGDKIVAVGTIFPFLLIETFRGYLELLSDNMLPENAMEAEEILDKSDVLTDEPWYDILGKTLWNRIVRDEEDAVTIISEVFSTDDNEFAKLMTNVIAGSNESEQMIDNLYKMARYHHDYSDFEKDLAKKREEDNLIVDSQELIDEDAVYPETFNIEEFKNITSFKGRVAYCKQRLRYLGKGTSRIVFQIDDNTVLKLAWNNKGIAQNEVEARVKNDYVLSGYNFLPEVYEVDENYQWIEMQLARKAKKSDFKRLTGYNWETFYYWVVYCWNKSVAYRHEQRSIPDDFRVLFNSHKWIDELGSYNLFSEIEDYIRNYMVQGWGDLATIQNWGVVTNKNGNEELVLVDNGIDNDVLDKYYK